MTLIDKITPENIRRLVPYASAKRQLLGVQTGADAIWLNANESPFDNGYGGTANTNRYPDFQSAALISAYADYAGVTPAQVLVTRGADEGIELLVRTFCRPGKDKILINPPTYGMYEICAETFNLGVEKVAMTAHFQPDIAGIIAAKSDELKLVFICCPNNPTGELVPHSALIEVLEAYQDSALVVVDEAYIEFCANQTVSQLIDRYPNLVILRTLSKAFALAGIRCGFTLAQADTIAMLQKVIAPYPVPVPVEQYALQALSPQGIGQMRQQVQTLLQQKQAFVEQLATFDCVAEVYPSDTNFVLLRLNNKTPLLVAMQQQDILLRDQSRQPNLNNCIRITIGSAEQMQAVLNVFKENN